MKRLLLALPFVILLLLNACGNYPIGGISPSDGTGVAHTQTATVWTITPSPTPVPNQAKIVEWLNAELSSTDHALEQTLDAKYQVLDVIFPLEANGTSTTMLITVRCDCATYGQCCNSERMFVVIIDSMQAKKDKIIEQVPATVGAMKVICYDHMNQFATMSASWSDVKNYLQSQINGYQLGSRVVRGSVP